MTNEKLDELVKNGSILSYEYINVDEDGNIGKSKFRNTERLKLNFPNGKHLTLDTFCSGSAEDTTIFFS